MTLRVAFVMDQVAGHVTVARNLRPIVEADPDLEVVWGEVHYHREAGSLERFHDRVTPFLPQHPFGVVRGIVEQRRALRTGVDAIFTNTAVAHYDVGPLRRTPTMFDFDSTPVQLDAMEGYSERPEPTAVARVKHAAVRRVFRAAAVNQAWSSWARRSVIDDYGIAPQSVVVNPPGIDLSAWSHDDRAGRDAARPRRVLFVGADFERKGGNDLLAWHRGLGAGRDGVAIELDLVTRAELDAPPGVCVHRDLQPNSPELRRLYRDADVFVLPSHGECFGIATIEAMATGLPVVVTSVGATADIVDDGGNGFIVAPRSPTELGRAIEAVLDDASRAAAMGRRSRVLATERFDLHVNAGRTIDRLKQLASDGRARAADSAR
jgi:glycosyltransferase involved in cell wall biosynthesis